MAVAWALFGQAKPRPLAESTGSTPVAVKPIVTPSPAQKARAGESLRYNVNWPSGLSLGEGQLTSAFQDGVWSYSFNVEAAVPGFTVSENARAQATGEGCAVELAKSAVRGKRKSNETTTFDGSRMTAVRTTKDGGKSELFLSPCAKDALSFLYYLRGELAAGRLPQSQKVYYGSPYQETVRYIGAQSLRIGGEAQGADHLVATIKGPSSESSVDLFFARDAARTPLLVQAPFPMGKFSLELAR